MEQNWMEAVDLKYLIDIFFLFHHMNDSLLKMKAYKLVSVISMPLYGSYYGPSHGATGIVADPRSVFFTPHCLQFLEISRNGLDVKREKWT